MEENKKPIESRTQIGIRTPIPDSSKTSRFDIVDNKALSLHCYYQVGDHWQHKQFSNKTQSIKIGPVNYDNEIGLNDQDMDKNQVIIHKLDESWYVMDCGRDDLMKVDGLPKRQIILKENASHALQIKDSFVVLSLTNKPDGEPKVRKAPPTPTEICFSISEADQYPFPAENCLIGANPICQFCTGAKDFLNNIAFDTDIQLFEKPFIGMIFKYQKNLFLQGFDGLVQVNEQIAVDPIQLAGENTVTFGKTILNLRIPPAAAGADPLTIPQIPEATFSLIPLDDPNRDFPELHIPASARSLTIGRSSSQSDIAINEKNISRQHAQFIVYPKSMMVYDCGSSNGTFVNEEKITKKTVRPGDSITFGDIPYFLCYAED